MQPPWSSYFADLLPTQRLILPATLFHDMRTYLTRNKTPAKLKLSQGMPAVKTGMLPVMFVITSAKYPRQYWWLCRHPWFPSLQVHKRTGRGLGQRVQRKVPLFSTQSPLPFSPSLSSPHDTCHTGYCFPCQMTSEQQVQKFQMSLPKSE